MRLNVSAWSIRRPVPSIILFLILTALGVMAFRGLPVERFPNIDFPLISVTVRQAGASPSELETQVSRRVEDAVSSVVGVKHMTSVLTDGASTTTVEFQLETNADRALNDVKDAITRIRMELPRTINEPIISRIDVTTMPIVTYAVSAPQMTLEELSWFIDDHVGREVQSVRGVAQIWRIGGVDREIRVSLDPQRLLALGVTAGDVNAQLRGTNADLSGGRSEIGGAEQTIRTLGGATTRRAAGLHEHYAAGRPQCAARRTGQDHQLLRRAAQFRPAERQAHCRAQHPARKRRKRSGGGRTR